MKHLGHQLNVSHGSRVPRNMYKSRIMSAPFLARHSDEEVAFGIDSYHHGSCPFVHVATILRGFEKKKKKPFQRSLPIRSDKSDMSYKLQPTRRSPFPLPRLYRKK
jgi:hypothetical protein